MRRVSNVPVPEENVAGIAVGVALHRIRPWTLPGPRALHHTIGWPLLTAGTYLVARSWAAAVDVDLSRPERLVTSGPYAVSRNPMYVGWALLHLGVGVVSGSAWVIATLPPAAGFVHRQVICEELTLAATFTEEFGRYQAAVPRYLSGVARRRCSG